MYCIKKGVSRNLNYNLLIVDIKYDVHSGARKVGWCLIGWDYKVRRINSIEVKNIRNSYRLGYLALILALRDVLKNCRLYSNILFWTRLYFLKAKYTRYTKYNKYRLIINRYISKKRIHVMDLETDEGGYDFLEGSSLEALVRGDHKSGAKPFRKAFLAAGITPKKRKEMFGI